MRLLPVMWRSGEFDGDFGADALGAFDQQQRMMRLAMDWPFKIVTPFLHKTKADEWALADRLGIFDLIANETVTCYRGIPGAGCGTCPACKLRNAGLRAYLQHSGRKI